MSKGTKQALRTRAMPDKRQASTHMTLSALFEWELGARACGELLGQNGPAAEGFLMQRLTRAWPFSRLVGQIIRLNIVGDDELYHVKSMDGGELVCDQLTYEVDNWPNDGTLKEWAIDPSSVAEAMPWEEFECVH